MFGPTLMLALLIPGKALARRYRAPGHHNYGYPLLSPPLPPVSSSESTVIATSITSITSSVETSLISPTSPTISTISNEQTTTTTSSVTLTSAVSTTSATIVPVAEPTFYIRGASQQHQLNILDDAHLGIVYYEDVPEPGGNLTLYTLDKQHRLKYVSPGFEETGWVGVTTRGETDFTFVDPYSGDIGPIFTACQCLINPPTAHLSCKCPEGFIDSTFIPGSQPLVFAPWQAFPVDSSSTAVSASLPRPTFVIRDATQEHELSLFYDNPLDSPELPTGNPYVGVRGRQPLGPDSALFTLNEQGDIIYATPDSPLYGQYAYLDGAYVTLFDRNSPQASGSSECIATIAPLTWELTSSCTIGGSPQGCWPWELCTNWYVYLVDPSDVSVIGGS